MKRLLLVAMLVATPAYATDYSKIEVRGSANNEQTTQMDTGLVANTFTSGAMQQSTVSLPAATTTNISVPSGAKAVIINAGTYKNLKLLGVSGDTGISLDSNCPVSLPLSSDGNTTLYIKNNSSSVTASARVYFF